MLKAFSFQHLNFDQYFGHNRSKKTDSEIFGSYLDFLNEQFTFSYAHWVTQKLPQLYTANLATFPIRIRKITVHICGTFWVTQ